MRAGTGRTARAVLGIVLLGVLAACGSGDGTWIGGVEVGTGYARTPGDTDRVDEVDVATGDTVEIVLPVTAVVATGNVRPNVLADVFVDGQDTTGIGFGTGRFAVHRQSSSRTELVLTLDGLLGAGELDRYATLLEEAGIDPADAGARVVEDRGDDGVLEVEVRVRGSVATTEAGDADVDEDVSFRVVGTAPTPTTTTTAPPPEPEPAPEPAPAPEAIPGLPVERGSAIVGSEQVLLAGPRGGQVMIAVPAGYQAGGGGDAGAAVYFTPPAGARGDPGTIFLGLVATGASFAESVDSYVDETFRETGARGAKRSDITVGGRPATLVTGNAGGASLIVVVADLGADVLTFVAIGDDAPANRRALQTLLDATTVTPS